MKPSRILAASSAALLTIAPSFAASFLWDGGGANDNISNAVNWNPDGAPPSDLVNTALLFGGAVRLTPNFSTAFSANSLSFINTAGAFTLGGAAITIGSGGIANSDLQTQTINNNVTLGTATSVFQAIAGALVLNGTLGLSTNALTLSGTQTMIFNGPITGTGSIARNSVANLAVGSTATAIGADFTINAGTLTIAPTGATQVFSSTSTIAMNGASTLDLNENTTLNGGLLTVASGATLTIASAKTLTAQAGADIAITGSYSTNSAATITVTGAGSTFSTGQAIFNNGSTVNILSGASFSNGVFSLAIGSGGSASTVTVDASSAFGGGPLTIGQTGGTGTLTYSGSSTGAFSSITLATSIGSGGFLNVQGTANVTAGSLNVAANSVVNSGAITVGGSNANLTINGGGSSTIGAISGSTATLNLQSGGSFTLANGLLTVRATGTIALTGGTFNADENVILDGGQLTNNASNKFIVAAGKTLTVQNGGDVNFAVQYIPTVAGNVVVTGSGSTFSVPQLVIGAGTSLSVLNGGLVSAAGDIQVGNSNGNGSLTVDGAGTTISTGPFNVGSAGGSFGTAVISNNAQVSADSVKVGGGFSSGGSLTLQSGADITCAGDFILAGTNTSPSSLNISGSGSTFAITVLSTASRIGEVSGIPSTLNLSGGIFSAGALNNSGTVRASFGTASAASGASGADASGGRIFIGDTLNVSGTLVNASGGRITLENGSGLLSGAGTLSNSGVFNLLGGTLDFTGALTNNGPGFISGHGALFTGGLANQGNLAFSGGATDVRGDVTNAAGARITTSGGATTTFYNDVIHNGTEIRTSAGGASVFFGAGPFTGTGTVYFEGDLRPGNSPASVLYEGDLVFGGSSSLTLEIGGLLSGTLHDHLNIGGVLHADGDLVLALLGAFTPQLGDTFDLFDVGTFAGDFDSITAPALAGGNAWDFSALKTNGSVTVVPEPGIGALGFLGMLRGRIRGACSSRALVSASRRNELPDAPEAENVHAFRTVQEVREGGTPSPALGTSALPGIRCAALSSIKPAL